MTTSIAAGSSASFGMDAWATLTLVVSSKATIALTSLAPNLLSSSVVSQAQSKTYGPFGVPMTVVVTAVDRGVTYDVVGDLIVNNAIVNGAGSVWVLVKSAGYHFHGYAPNQINSDLKFLDYSGALNDGAFQADLTAANAWATARFLTQADAADASNLQLTAIPALSWDWLAGDNLFMFWRGRATPEGSDMPLMGDTSGASAGNGVKVNISSAGKLKVNAYQNSGSLSRFGGTGTSTIAEAAISHSFAFCISSDGNHCYWSDGARDAAYSGGFLALGAGAVDTVNSVTWKLGGDGSTSGSVQVGLACQTEALVILKGRRGVVPVASDLDAMVAALHRNPQLLVNSASW